ncbi:hypothetical protein [Chryseobacterium indoltheticum]|uniref:hypothetical protein n=1 Tax=Chryseobacterium indoltheticum TaxID=254 RepID=UPI003F496A9D
MLAHGDHIADVEEVLQHYPEATVIGQPEICAYFKSAQNKDDVNLGGSAKIDDLKFQWFRLITQVRFLMELTVECL